MSIFGYVLDSLYKTIYAFHVSTTPSIINKMLSGDRPSLSRLISMIENDHPDTALIMKEVMPHTGRAHIIGITGFAGAGKSTIIDRLAASYRMDGLLVGIITVDPSSPLSGGAILGDRIRMGSHQNDEGVFIRSMATRGSLGGLARNTYKAIALFDAFGFQKIMVETIGVGQDEIDIGTLVHTCVVVVTPGHGDSLQALKAGIFEIADILVINKIDAEEPLNTISAFESIAMMTHKKNKWAPRVVAISAKEGKNIENLMGAIEEHHICVGTRREGFIKERGLEFIISSILLDIFKERLGARYPAFKKRLFQEGVDIYAEIEHIINVGGRKFFNTNIR